MTLLIVVAAGIRERKEGGGEVGRWGVRRKGVIFTHFFLDAFSFFIFICLH